MSTPDKEEAARAVRAHAQALQEAISYAATLGLDVRLELREAQQFGSWPAPVLIVSVTEEVGR